MQVIKIATYREITTPSTVASCVDFAAILQELTVETSVAQSAIKLPLLGPDISSH
jgi:hypothetical protein